jgi:hypothetical protein
MAASSLRNLIGRSDGHGASHAGWNAGIERAVEKGRLRRPEGRSFDGLNRAGRELSG